MNYWLLKSDPETYSFDDFKKEGTTCWSGVRNYQARNFLQKMEIGDLALFYHSQTTKSVVGIAKVVRTSYPDPTIDDERWVAVDIEYYQDLPKEITLEQIKENPVLQDIPLVKQQRLSVMQLTKEQYAEILRLANL